MNFSQHFLESVQNFYTVFMVPIHNFKISANIDMYTYKMSLVQESSTVVVIFCLTSRISSLSYQLYHCQISLPKIQLLLYHSQPHSLQQLDIVSKVKPKASFISAEFPCPRQTRILTVLQTSFQPPTFAHSFPFYGIPSLPSSPLIELLPFL